GRCDGACSRHILHNHVGISWNIFADVPGQQPGGAVIAAAGAQPYDNANGFAIVKIPLSPGGRNQGGHEKENAHTSAAADQKSMVLHENTFRAIKRLRGMKLTYFCCRRTIS